MCIVERAARRVMVGKWFWCVKAGEGHREVANLLEIAYPG